VILDSYSDAKVRGITLNGATEPIEIKRRVKQGCLLSPILFDNCVDPLIEKLSSEEFIVWDIGGASTMASHHRLMLVISYYLQTVMIQ
jgi:hypothetical protein